MQLAPQISLTPLEAEARPHCRLAAALAAVTGVIVGACMLAVGMPATASAQSASAAALGCDLVTGSVDARRGSLHIAVTNPTETVYNVLLFNKGPVGLQSAVAMASGSTAFDVTFDRVDIGYSARRAVEQRVASDFSVGITPRDLPPTLENSTFCTGTASWIDNPVDGNHFKVSH